MSGSNGSSSSTIIQSFAHRSIVNPAILTGATDFTLAENESDLFEPIVPEVSNIKLVATKATLDLG